MKKLILILISILLSTFILGCIGSNTGTNPVQTASTEDLGKYGITGRGTNDAPYILSARSGTVNIPLAIVKDGIQYYSYNDTKFFTLKGLTGVQTRISICEPCRGLSFHLQNNGREVVCDTCGTVWSTQDFKGISGGCLAYPPPYLANSLSNDSQSITVKKTDIDPWSDWFK